MSAPLRDFAGAVAFLTRVPVAAHARSEADLARAVPWFPVVGALVGLMTAVAFWLGTEVVPPLAAAALAITTQLVITGAIHEDGLADVADAVGGASVAERRRILHDPRHGTYGVLALVASVVVRTALLAALAPGDATGALVAAHGLGRGAAVGAIVPDWTAAEEGLGAGHARHLSAGSRALGIGAGIAVAVMALLAAGEPVAAPVAVTMAAGAGLGMVGWGRQLLGGVSGDLLGAVEQVVEVATLVAVVALSQ